MRTLFNFSAGPAMLPEDVLRQADRELLDWHGTGMSVMEMSHREKDYMGIHAQAQADLRELLAVPDDYRILFMAGGATLQFAALVMNLLPEGGSVDYVDTGVWAGKAIQEADGWPVSASPPAARPSATPACPPVPTGSSTPRPPTSTSAPTRPLAA